MYWVLGVCFSIGNVELNIIVIQVYRVYTNERSDRMFSESLLISVVVLALNEVEAKFIVLNRFTNSFVCKDSELLVEVITEPILSVEYNNLFSF